MSLTLESLGFTNEELQNRVVDQLCEQLLTDKGYTEDGDEYPQKSNFSAQVQKLVLERTEQTIAAIAEKYVLPDVAKYVETLVIQQTNEWGEAKKAPVTFIEYLVGRAQAYLQEKVDHNGKGKTENDSYSWTGKETRITHLVHQHLSHSIETAMKDALKIATGEVAKGIHETARLKLNEIAASLKVTVATR